MRAVVLREHGGPDVLRIEEVPDPVPGPEEILVAIRASALNRADLLQRMGLYANPHPEEVEIPGLEYSGVVRACGERVREWVVGDDVMGIAGGGAHAEQIAVHERQVMRVPESVGVANAAAIPEVFITAWDALVERGGLTSGRWALVHAGASGVGTAAIQIAKAIGARIVVTCSAAKVEACRSLGADEVIDYGSRDFVEVVAGLTNGAGVDVILDVVGGDYLERNLRSLAVRGSIVQVGLMGGGRTSIDLGVLLSRRLHLVGTVLRARPLEEKIDVTQRFAAQILPLFDREILRPIIDTRFGLTHIAEAHAHMAANANIGKILIDVAS